MLFFLCPNGGKEKAPRQRAQGLGNSFPQNMFAVGDVVFTVFAIATASAACRRVFTAFNIA